MPSTFVLVHGAWHGGWCWVRVADRLRAQGHTVFTPTLTGLGERAHLFGPGITLATHITDVVNLIKWEGLSDVVLCGHSYGGFVVSGTREALGALGERTTVTVLGEVGGDELVLAHDDGTLSWPLAELGAARDGGLARVFA